MSFVTASGPSALVMDRWCGNRPPAGIERVTHFRPDPPTAHGANNPPGRLSRR